MEKYFKTIEGKYVNLINHTIEQLEKWPDLSIRISTDSQSSGYVTTYATVIVFRYGKRGAHYVVFKEEVPRERVEYMRLYNEGMRTLDAEKILTESIPSIRIDALEFDFSDIKKTISTSLVGVFKGYNNATFKSDSMVASKAADHECRRSSNLFDMEEALLQVA